MTEDKRIVAIRIQCHSPFNIFPNDSSQRRAALSRLERPVCACILYISGRKAGILSLSREESSQYSTNQVLLVIITTCTRFMGFKLRHALHYRQLRHRVAGSDLESRTAAKRALERWSWSWTTLRLATGGLGEMRRRSSDENRESDRLGS